MTRIPEKQQMRNVVIAIGIFTFAWAQIFFDDKVEIRFEAGKLSPEITWSDQMESTPSGLATLGPGAPNTSRDFWLQTQPMPAGPSWRPPRNAGITVTLVGAEFAGQVNSGFLRAWGRYGADRVHWSSWFPLAGTVANVAAKEFKGSMAKPYFAPSRYQDLLPLWWRTNPAWSSDEHDYCLWLAANHPDVFESEIPFMGYVQVFVEGNAQRFRLKGLSIAISSSAGGLSAIPRSPRRATADDKWFFELPIKR